MRTFTKFAFYLLAFIMPFGSINPFNLSAIQGVESQNIEQQGILPYIFALCVMLAFADWRVRRHAKDVKGFILPLSVLFAALLFSSLIYASGFTNYISFFLKLLAGEIGFLIIAQYFIEYPSEMNRSLMIYAYVCVGIVTAFFLGLLNGYYYISKGRLWLFGMNPNIFSFLMGWSILIFTNDIARSKMSKLWMSVKIAAIFIVFLYILLSGSRGTVIILGVCMILLIYEKMKRYILYVIPVVLLLSWMTVSFVSNHIEDISIVERFMLLKEGDDDRSTLLKQAYSLFEENPIIGLGRNGYVEQRLMRFNEERDSHNMFLSVAVMSGIIGLMALLSYLFLLGKKCLRVFRKDSMGAVCFLYVLLMTQKTGDVITFSMMWYCFAVVVALTNNNYTYMWNTPQKQ